MSTKTIAIAAICVTMAACSTKNEEVANRVELPGTVDNEKFVANIESISVMNLEMSDEWLFDDELRFCISDKYLYLLCGDQINLTCLDRHTGEKLSGRTIKGNGPGEVNYLNSAFCIGDTLCIYENAIHKYSNNGDFLGKTPEIDKLGSISDIFRLTNGDYVGIYLDIRTPDSIPSKVVVADKSFNVKARHFDLPKVLLFISIGGSGKSYSVNGDTVRFLFYGQMDNHLYTLCGDTELCTELGLPNPQTAERLIEVSDKVYQTHDGAAIDELFEYDGCFRNLCESGRFVCLGYTIDKSQQYVSLIDKRTNSAVSLFSEDEQQDTLMHSLYGVLINMQVLHSDGEYIYALCKNRDLVPLLEGHDDELNNCLQKAQSDYHAYLDRNAEYMKSMEPEERDLANVILKIKLKD